MTGFQQALALIGALFGLAVLAGGVYAVFRTAAQDARLKVVSGQRDDYLQRLNYIEPKVTKLEEQNRILLELHNPAEQIKQLASQEQTNHDRTVELLEQQSTVLSEIETRLHPGSKP